MEIIYDRPPNFAQIVKVFPSANGKGVIFTYGNKIYSPTRQEISPHLMKHEQVHSARQGVGPDNILLWWENYLKDKEFRYREELLAHIAEYQSHIDFGANRQIKRRALMVIARRLSSPLYGSMTTRRQAKKDIVGAK